MMPRYDLNKIKFATDSSTWEKAVDLYDTGKVTVVESDAVGFSAIVVGGNRYHVYVYKAQYDRGACDCYLGRQDILCKHMVAVAIYAVCDGKVLSVGDREQHNEVVCSGQLGTLTKTEISTVKKQITEAMRYIKPYNGPSRTWFAYQDSLQEGANRLSAIISSLPVSKQTAELSVDLLLRIDRKLCNGGVDDSDGVVGGFIQESVELLKGYAKLNPQCVEAFEKLKNKDTCFGWEEPLVRMVSL